MAKTVSGGGSAARTAHRVEQAQQPVGQAPPPQRLRGELPGKHWMDDSGYSDSHSSDSDYGGSDDTDSDGSGDISGPGPLEVGAAGQAAEAARGAAGAAGTAAGAAAGAAGAAGGSMGRWAEAAPCSRRWAW
jgi:hypothetical protein